MAATVLAVATALASPARRPWARAMQAELASIDTSADRWRFTRGCAIAIMKGTAAGPVVALGVTISLVSATVVLTARTAYAPMHFALIAMVCILGAVYLIGDRSTLLTDATRSRLGGGVRAGGALALAWLAEGIVLSFRSGDGNVVDRASTGVPIFTVLIALYLLGFMSLTSPTVADTWMLVRGVGLGLAAAVLWLVTALARLPLPLSSGSAFAILVVAAVVAACIGAARGAALITAACTGLVGALSIFVAIHLALLYGPPSWIPSDTAALTPAARLAQSRVEAGESYLLVFLVGVVSAIILIVGASCPAGNQYEQQDCLEPSP